MPDGLLAHPGVRHDRTRLVNSARTQKGWGIHRSATSLQGSQIRGKLSTRGHCAATTPRGFESCLAFLDPCSEYAASCSWTFPCGCAGRKSRAQAKAPKCRSYRWAIFPAHRTPTQLELQRHLFDSFFLTLTQETQFVHFSPTVDIPEPRPRGPALRRTTHLVHHHLRLRPHCLLHLGGW
jgi:hypothetical protein